MTLFKLLHFKRESEIALIINTLNFGVALVSEVFLNLFFKMLYSVNFID